MHTQQERVWRGNLFLLISILSIIALILNLNHCNAFWAVFIQFLALILVPGLAISCLFNFQSEDLLDRGVLIIALGFVYTFSLIFIAILLGWRIDFLCPFYFVFLFFIYSLSLLLSFYRFGNLKVSLSFKLARLFNRQTFLFWAIGFFLLIVFYLVIRNGANFSGDPLYHLTIVRRAFEGDPLTVHNLSYKKDTLFLPYLFPIWQVFVAFLARIFYFSPVNAWFFIPGLIFPLLLVVWYWLLRKFMPTHGLAIIALLFFVLFIFKTALFPGVEGYLFQRLPVPDTLNMLFFFPLSLVLALRYIFGAKVALKDLGLMLVFILFMALNHFTQYAYFIITILSFGIIYSVFYARTDDYKITIKRVAAIVAVNLGVVILFAAIAELSGKALSAAMNTYFNLEGQQFSLFFDHYELMGKIAYFLLPLAFVVAAKYRKLLFPLSMLCAIPVMYEVGWLSNLIIKLGSLITLRRAYDNLVFSYVVWALIAGFIFFLIDRLFNKISFAGRLLIQIILSFILVFIIIGQVRDHWLSSLYQWLFSDAVIVFLASYQYYILAATIILSVLALILKHFFSRPWENFFTIEEYTHPVLIILLLALFSLPLSFHVFDHAKAMLKTPGVNKTFTEVQDLSHLIAGLNDPHSADTLAFFEKNIPKGSIIYAKGGYSHLPLLMDYYLPDHEDYGSDNGIFLSDKQFPVEYKLMCIYIDKIDYIIATPEQVKMTPNFDQHPAYFTRLFRKDMSVYKVNRDVIAPIAQREINLGTNPNCRGE